MAGDIYVPTRAEVAALSSTLQEGGQLPPYLERGFESALEFTEAMGGNKGLLLLFGPKDRVIGVIGSTLNGELTEEYSQFNPLLYNNPKVLELYMRMLPPKDGGIAFDIEGNVIGTEITVDKVSDEGLEHTMADVRRRKRNDSIVNMRCLAAAFASLHGVPAIAVSEEVGTVMAFYEGRLLDELFYDPRLKIRMEVEHGTALEAAPAGVEV